MRHRSLLLFAAVGIALVALSGTLRAGQGGNAGGAAKGGGPLPIPPAQGLDPSQVGQFQSLMEMRALQLMGRRHHGGQASPGPIIINGGPFDPSFMAADEPDQNASGTHKSAAQKRAEAREMRAERMRLAREKAEKKKAKASQPAKPAKGEPKAKVGDGAAGKDKGD